MKVLMTIAAGFGLLLFSGISPAEEVLLPAPVLKYSFYIFLMFALVVAFGIFFVRTKKEVVTEPVISLIEEPGVPVHSVGPQMSVTDCIRQMIEHKIGAMLVMEDGKLLGIFTERDCLTKVVGAGLDPSTTQIAGVMTANPTCISPSTTFDEAMSIITHQRFRHLPVVENGHVLGVVSSGDLTHRLVQDRSVEIRDLVDTAGRRRASL